jgi:homoserine kinase
MPLGSGLGSSAASSVGGAVAVNALFGDKLSKHDIVNCALQGEAVASGTAHADNVAPSVFGGIVLIRTSDPLDVIALPVPTALRVVVVHPHTEVLTAEARRLVAERHYTIGQAVQNLGNVAALVTALHQENLALFARSISDALVEPVRAPLVPGYATVKKAALDAGALGCSISGSGPSVVAFADSDTLADHVATAIEDAFLSHSLTSNRYVGPVNGTGAQVV